MSANFQTNDLKPGVSGQDAAGYVTDVDYVREVVNWQLPTSILQACEVSGRTGPRLDKPLVYMDLGAGYGEGVLCACSANPNIHGIIVDMLPQHIQQAKARAKALGLTNVTCLQTTFEKFPLDEVPQCDIIVLHGVMSWIEPHIQRQALEIIRSKLKPTGVVYVSYNAYPGWAVYEPLNVLLRTMAAPHPGLSTDKLALAMQDAAQMEKVGSTFFNEHPRALRKLNKIIKQNPNYLVHEYMNSAQYPKYFYQMQDDMAQRGLTYAGDTKLMRNYAHLFLSSAQAKICDQYTDTVQKLTVMDFFLNTVFRREVYAGAQCLPNEQDGGQFFYMALPGVKVDQVYEVETGHQKLQLNRSPFKDIVALCKAPITLGEMQEQLGAYTRAQLVLAVHVLCEAGAIEPLWDPKPGQAWARARAAGQNPSWRDSQQLVIDNPWNREALDEGVAQGGSATLISATSGKTVRLNLLDSLCLKAAVMRPQEVGHWLASQAVTTADLRGALVKAVASKNGPAEMSDGDLIARSVPILLAQYQNFLTSTLDRLVILGIVRENIPAKPDPRTTG